MKTALNVVLALVLVLPVSVLSENSAPGLAPVRNARMVYVTSYSGPQLSTNLLPEDRRAIGNVEQALQKQGYTIVLRPQEAEMIVVVQSRPSEDVLAVYDRASWRSGTYLWRAMQKGGLAGPSVPLVSQLEAALGNRPAG